MAITQTPEQEDPLPPDELRRELDYGMEALEQGRVQRFDDAGLTAHFEQIKAEGRKRLKQRQQVGTLRNLRRAGNVIIIPSRICYRNVFRKSLSKMGIDGKPFKGWLNLRICLMILWKDILRGIRLCTRSLLLLSCEVFPSSRSRSPLTIRFSNRATTARRIAA